MALKRINVGRIEDDGLTLNRLRRMSRESGEPGTALFIITLDQNQIDQALAIPGLIPAQNYAGPGAEEMLGRAVDHSDVGICERFIFITERPSQHVKG